MLVVLLLLLAGGAAALAIPLIRQRVARTAPPAARPASRPVVAGRTGSAPPMVVAAAPSHPKTRLHADQPADFAVVARGGSLRYGWTLDGRAAGTGPRWVWTPTPGDVGTHRVAVTVLGPGGGVTQEWTVRVQPKRPPPTSTARASEPAAAPEHDAPAASAPAPITTAGTTPATTPPLAMTPVPAEDLARPQRTPAVPPRPTPPPPAPPARATPPPVETAATRPAEPPERPSARRLDDEPPQVAVRTEERSTSRATPTAPPRRRGAADRTARAEGPRGTGAEVRRWLQRWAAAWNAHDVEALRRMGQMSTAGDAEAVRRYLAQVTDLDVSVNVIGLRDEGERVVVRFVRRDRFRDPAGRLVEHESPPIEKVLLRTADGFRVARGAS